MDWETHSSRVTLFLHLTVWLSPQAQPYLVFEGDILILRCRGRKNAALSQVKFYRDEKLLHFSKNNQPLFLGTATANSSGRYNCTGRVKYARNTDSWDSGTVMVQVQVESPLGGWDGYGAAQGPGLRGQQSLGLHPSLWLPLLLGQSSGP